MTLSGRLAAFALGLSVVGCSGTSAKPTVLPSDLKSPFTGYASATYRDPARWLCLPGRADACRRDLTATEIHADGWRAVRPQAVAEDAPIDCFYVYPTVDDRLLVAANHDDFSNLEPMTAATTAQAALFGQVCALYVPLYRQITLGTYFRGAEQREVGLAVAFSDVADAFLHYMANYNHGRKIVLLGHSQGAEMVKRLLLRFFDEDPVMRERLLLAMPIGGDLDVPAGRTVGGTFQNLPLCTADDEVGCVVAYRSHREDSAHKSGQKVPRGHEAMCVNPGNVTERGAYAPLRSYIPTLRDRLHGLDGVTTPYVYYPDLYAARCVSASNGRRVLEIEEVDEPGGMRERPIDLSGWAWGTRMGTHIADFQFPLGDLIEMVRARARGVPRSSGSP